MPPIVYLTRVTITIASHLPHDSFFHHPARTLAALMFGRLAVVLGEEPGWRAFALPRLIERLGPNVGRLVLGIAWALWHLPLFVVAGTPQYGTPFVPFLVTLTAWSMVITLFDALAGQRSSGDALPRIRKLVCVHDVGIRAGCRLPNTLRKTPILTSPPWDKPKCAVREG